MQRRIQYQLDEERESMRALGIRGNELPFLYDRPGTLYGEIGMKQVVKSLEIQAEGYESALSFLEEGTPIEDRTEGFYKLRAGMKQNQRLIEQLAGNLYQAIVDDGLE